MNSSLRNILAVACLAISAQASAEATLYELENFAGQSFSTTNPVGNLERLGFNDRASSVVVLGGRWEVCEDARFGGRCVVLRPGRYPSLAAMGLNDRVSSVRTVSRDTRIDDNRYAHVSGRHGNGARVIAVSRARCRKPLRCRSAPGLLQDNCHPFDRGRGGPTRVYDLNRKQVRARPVWLHRH